MDRIPYPAAIDPADYAFDQAEPQVKYGLPKAICFCRKCVVSNQRPTSSTEFRNTADSKKSTIGFDDEGVCDACRVAEEKDRIDWVERERQLRELCDRFRRDDGRYDCLVPGSGGKDSFYTSHVLKYKYGMKPLTVTWAPHIHTEWGWRNFQAWINSGFDNQLFTPNPRVHRLLTRLATEILYHPFQPFILGQKNLPPKLSALLDIPLVFYGENEAEYGNSKSDAAKPYRDWSYFTASDKSQIHLGGVSVGDLTGDFGLSDNDLDMYMPADPGGLKRVGTEVHYLGYYLRWHPQGCYYYAQEHGGFEPSPERTPGTYSKYNSIDDRLDDFHYFTTFIKFGIGRATSDAAQEVRSGDIDRDEAVALVRRFDGEFPTRFADEVFRYLSVPEKDFGRASAMFEQSIMDQEYFDRLTDRFRSPHIWRRDNGEWQLRRTVWHQD